MVERTGGKKLTANELVLQKLKETFERNGIVNADSNGTNVWVMLVAAEPFSDLHVENLSYQLTVQKPTHRARVVLFPSLGESPPFTKPSSLRGM